MAELRAELKRIAPQKRGDIELDTPFRQAMVAGGGVLALVAGLGLLGRSRRKGP